MPMPRTRGSLPRHRSCAGSRRRWPRSGPATAGCAVGRARRSAASAPESPLPGVSPLRAGMTTAVRLQGLVLLLLLVLALGLVAGGAGAAIISQLEGPTRGSRGPSELIVPRPSPEPAVPPPSASPAPSLRVQPLAQCYPSRDRGAHRASARSRKTPASLQQPTCGDAAGLRAGTTDHRTRSGSPARDAPTLRLLIDRSGLSDRPARRPADPVTPRRSAGWRRHRRCRGRRQRPRLLGGDPLERHRRDQRVHVGQVGRERRRIGGVEPGDGPSEVALVARAGLIGRVEAHALGEPGRGQHPGQGHVARPIAW